MTEYILEFKIGKNWWEIEGEYKDRNSLDTGIKKLFKHLEDYNKNCALGLNKGVKPVKIDKVQLRYKKEIIHSSIINIKNPYKNK